MKNRKEIPPPSAEIILKWFAVSFPPIETTKKSERTKLKVRGKHFGMVKRKKQPVTKLTGPLFCIVPRLDQDNLGYTNDNMWLDRCSWCKPCNAFKTKRVKRV